MVERRSLHFHSGKTCRMNPSHKDLRYTATNRCVGCARARAVKRDRLMSPATRARVRAQKYASHHKKRGLPDPTRPQPHSCECCGRPRATHRRLDLDHEHASNRFRGWLCNTCNRGIGLLGDTISGVKRALRYLKR